MFLRKHGNNLLDYSKDRDVNFTPQRKSQILNREINLHVWMRSLGRPVNPPGHDRLEFKDGTSQFARKYSLQKLSRLERTIWPHTSRGFHVYYEHDVMT
jgi:hypothetical protein